MAPIALITISREFGAGGTRLGQILADRLGWRLLDRELVHAVAERLACTDAEVAACDEHPPSLMERVAAAFTISPPEAPVLLNPPVNADPDRVAWATRRVLLEAVRTPPLIVIGHGGQCLFRDRGDTLHLRLVAPYSHRLQVVCRRSGENEAAAAAAIRHRDADRQHYVRRYYQREWTDPCLYSLQLNTARVPVETAAELVTQLVAAQQGAPAT